MAVQLAHEVGGRDRPGTALVVKPDLVGHRMVAKDDRQLVPGLADLPGPIEQLGMADVAPAVAADLAAGRAAQDLFVGRDPLDPVLGQERDHRLADRALAGPHAPRPFAEVADVALDGAADMHRGVFGVTAAIGRQGHVGHRLPRRASCRGAAAGSGGSRASWSARSGPARPARDAAGSPAPPARAACPGTTASRPRCSTGPWP